MTRTTIALLTSAAMVIGSAVTLSGQGKKGASPKPTHVTTSKPTTTKVSSKAPSGPKKTTTVSQTSKAPKGPKTTTAKATKAPKTTTAKATKAPKTTTKTAKSTTSKSSTKSAKADTKKTTKSAKADTKLAKAESKPSKTEKASTTTTTTTTDGEGDTPTTTPDGDGDTPETLTKVQEKLQKNTKLAEKLEGRLPAGTDLMEAAEGFKNLGQFVAAVNVSNNLGLDFDTLKTAMVDDGKSLGQAIQYVKSDVANPTTVAKTAETEAQTLIQQTEKTTTTTASTATTSTKTKSKDKPRRTLRTQSGS